MAKIRAVLGGALQVARKVGMGLFPNRLADRILLRPLELDPVRSETILIAPPTASTPKFSGGNIGDRAMIEAFLDNVGGPVRLIVTAVEGPPLPARFADRVSVEEMPGLVYGWGFGNVRALRTLRRRLAGAAQLAVVGADIMDGAYNRQASINRARVARLAATVGVDSRVLGFSWNASPNPGAAAALRAAGAAGAALMLRDPVSFGRAAATELPGIVQAADMVFAAREIDTGKLHECLGPVSGRYALVNVSGMVGRSLDQAVEYDQVIRTLLGRGVRVVLLPHVSRPGVDDIQACRAVWEQHRADGVLLVDRLLQPAEILGLCSAAEVVVTGRMHLSIMALNSGVPAITLSTQGKVEGLFQLFDMAENCVDPVPGFGLRLATAVDRALDDGELRARIGAALVEVRTLASRNFRGLPCVEGAPVNPPAFPTVLVAQTGPVVVAGHTGRPTKARG